MRWIPASETRPLCQSHSNPAERRQRCFDKGKVIFTYKGRRSSSRANRKNSKYPLRLDMILIIYIHVYRQHALYTVYICVCVCVCVCMCFIYTKSPTWKHLSFKLWKMWMCSHIQPHKLVHVSGKYNVMCINLYNWMCFCILFCTILCRAYARVHGASLIAQWVRNPPLMQETKET